MAALEATKSSVSELAVSTVASAAVATQVMWNSVNILSQRLMI
jgi:hypothetical protein